MSDTIEFPEPKTRPLTPAELAALNGASNSDATTTVLRTRGIVLDRVRPTRWLWARRIPMGYLSLIVGEEGIGKGTFAAWVIARATCGELDGDLTGERLKVLVIGDEDSFEPIWVPRLYAAGADLTKLRTLDDGEYVDDFRKVEDGLASAIADEGIGLVLLDALLDHVPGGAGGGEIYNPKSVREALKPIRRVAATKGIAVLALMHPIKGTPSNFRQLVAGSHQFNAVSRSSLLLAADPTDDQRRVVVRGKGNHSAAPRSIEFRIAAEAVDLNAHTFEVPKVVDLAEGERTVADLLKLTPAAPVREELAERLADRLTDEPKTRADLARAVDRSPKDGSVLNALEWLELNKRAERTPEKRWKRR